ncbi:OmpA family protein [Robiginitalea myxolifaciens]|nr:OmpA family protein [Robiginitalea myxolifaciens]
MKIKLSILVALAAGIFIAQGQQGRVNRANQNFESYSFKPAQDIYQKVLDRGYQSEDLLRKLGDTYYFNADYTQAAEIYGRLMEEYGPDLPPAYLFRYAQALKSVEDYQKAEEIMQRFAAVTRNDSRAIQFEAQGDYLAEIEENSGRYTPAPFQYNSEYADFAPAFYDGGLLFSSDRDTGNLARYRHTWNGQDFLDIYKIHTDSAQARVGKLDVVNSRYHESTTALSPDGSTLYFTRTNTLEGKKKGKDDQGITRLKIYRIQRNDSLGWGPLEELPINDDSFSVAHPAISPDGKFLYFASDRPGTMGESDIFRSRINEDGTFGEVENLGPKINTAGRETFPFISSDSILYFSSEGHPGLGGLDVFATKLAYLPYSGKVLNVGRPINSPADDFTYIIQGDTRIGYFASSRADGEGSDDIYSFVENRPLNFECIQLITGTVRDKVTNEVLPGATVRVIDENNQEVGSAITDREGNFELTLDCNRINFVRASREGYVPAEEYLEPSDGKPRIIDFYLEPETVTGGFGDDLFKLLQLSTIYFDFDKYEIRPDAEVELQKVIAAMEKYPSLKIKANSHTDSRGPDAYNRWLSQKRAEATVAYMISKGIPADRLTSEGFGESKLINGCEDGVSCSEAQHQENRRSEFIIQE